MAIANQSGGAPVTVNTGDVQRGHYRFSDGNFFPNNSLDAVDLWGKTAAELDANPAFINAVQVTTRRPAAPSFFARIFGYDNFALSAAAVAYIGFAGTLEPGALDQPIAICRESIRIADEYTCTVGRMINSGNKTGDTAGWTNFSQPCHTASASSVKPLVCATGNVTAINLGEGIGTTNGMLQVAFDDLMDCWKAPAQGLDTDGDGLPDKPWKMTLPVIECSGNKVDNCSKVVGAVELNVIWITRTGDKKKYKEVPRKMAGWTCAPTSTGEACWTSFVQHFNLKDVNSDASYEDKTIYFLPDCTPHEPKGTTGGENFGILARIPVLVK